MKTIAIALVLIAGPALAQEACPAAPALDAGMATTEAPNLKPAQAVSLILKSAPQIHYTAPAHRATDPKAFGGLAALDVPSAAVWRISLGSTAWIAVVQNGAEIQSATHHHGDSCLVKMVDFPLQAGKATLEISAAPDNTVRVMAAPAVP